MTQMTVEDFNGMGCDYDHSLMPLDKGNTPASPGPLPPGGCVDAPGPVQRWPYEGESAMAIPDEKPD